MDLTELHGILIEKGFREIGDWYELTVSTPKGTDAWEITFSQNRLYMMPTILVRRSVTDGDSTTFVLPLSIVTEETIETIVESIKSGEWTE